LFTSILVPNSLATGAMFTSMRAFIFSV
jgi:hypothetical protein